MPSVYASEDLFTHGVFLFEVVDQSVGVDARGVKRSTGRNISIKFMLMPQGGQANQVEEGAKLTESYRGYVVAVDGDEETTSLPPQLKPGDVGTGSYMGRSCTATIRTFSPSSVTPAVAPIVGDRVNLELDYRVRGGNPA